MKNGKTCGLDRVPTEVLKHLGDWGVCVKSPTSSTQSRKAAICRTNGERGPSHLSNTDKGDHSMNCSNYRGIKLLSQTMKLLGAYDRPKAQEHCSKFRWSIWIQDWGWNHGCHVFQTPPPSPQNYYAPKLS